VIVSLIASIIVAVATIITHDSFMVRALSGKVESGFPSESANKKS
jgi:hypothetical protein